MFTIVMLSDVIAISAGVIIQTTIMIKDEPTMTSLPFIETTTCVYSLNLFHTLLIHPANNLSCQVGPLGMPPRSMIIL